MTDELRPCPFCGGRAMLTADEIPHCTGSCEVAPDFGWGTDWVARWNKRTSVLRDDEGLREVIVEEMTAWKVRCTPWMNASYDEPLDAIIAAVKERL